MASLSEMLITPKSAALPVFASCAVAVPIPRGIDASARAAVPARESDKRMEHTLDMLCSKLDETVCEIIRTNLKTSDQKMDQECLDLQDD